MRGCIRLCSGKSAVDEGACNQRQDSQLVSLPHHRLWLAMMADSEDAGKALYEERLKLLPGLWMPAAPDWEDLPDEVKERWRSHALHKEADGSDPE